MTDVQSAATDPSANSKTSRPMLLRHGIMVASMTLLSRILGFMRDVVLAMVFGAGAQLDAFLIAFKIANFVRRLFGEGAFAQAFVPVLTQYKIENDHETVSRFVSRMFTQLSLVLLLLVGLAEIFASGLLMLFAPGFLHDPQRWTWSLTILHITLPYIWLICITAMCGAVLNTHQRFLIPAFAPVLLNVALITMAWYATPFFTIPVYALSWGVIVGGVLQLSIQIPIMMKLNLLPRFAISWQDPAVKKVFRLMIPALFGVSVAQISLMIDNVFASFLSTGSISWLYYSDRLTYLPLGVIGVALSTVILPTLSREHHQNSKHYHLTLQWALRTVLFFGVPAAAALMCLAIPILATLFLHGNFHSHDVIMTQRALVAFAFGLPAFMLIKILASAFYARQDIKTPVKVAAMALVINVIGNGIFIRYLQHAGLALSTSIAAYVNALVLGYFLLRHQSAFFRNQWLTFLAKLGLACGAMVLILWLGIGPQSFWLSHFSILKLLHLIGLILVGMVTYLLIMWFGGWRPRDLRSPS